MMMQNLHLNQDNLLSSHHPRHTLKPSTFPIIVLHQLNECTLLLLTPDGKERKTITGDVKPCTMADLTESAWDSFILSFCNKLIQPTKMPYNLRPRM